MVPDTRAWCCFCNLVVTFTLTDNWTSSVQILEIVAEAEPPEPSHLKVSRRHGGKVVAWDGTVFVGILHVVVSVWMQRITPEVGAHDKRHSEKGVR